MAKNISAKTVKMVQLAILAALILVMAFTPLGYLKVGVVSITFIMIPVGVGAILLGPAAGAFLGGIFGLTSFVQCFGMDYFGTTLFGINPVFTFIMCMAPRILMGWFCGLVFKGMIKIDRTQHKIPSYAVTCLCSALINTVLFVGLLFLFFGNSEFIQGFKGGMNWLAFFAAFVGLNGLMEAVSSMIIGTAVAKAVDSVRKRQAAITD